MIAERTRGAVAVAAALGFLLAGCGRAGTPASPAVSIEQRARELGARAAAAEPSVTPVLIELAGRLGGEMIKLEHRLKTRASTERKLRKQHGENPRVSVAELTIDDSLRYTMRFEDQPPGHHIESIKRVLAALELRGHRIWRLKNYWPLGDNYSGVNGVLVHPSGLRWELQFHTARSLEVQARTRAWYEELREVGTPAARKRQLFDQMSEQWVDVPIPRDILVPRSLHQREEIRTLPRP